MSEFPDTVAGIAMSPQAAQALKEGKTLAELLGWDPPELPAEEIPILIDPRMEPGDVALYGPEQWRRRVLGLQSAREWIRSLVLLFRTNDVRLRG